MWSSRSHASIDAGEPRESATYETNIDLCFDCTCLLELFRSEQKAFEELQGSGATGVGARTRGRRECARHSSASVTPYNLPGIQFPRIEADSRVTFQFKAPDAKKVQVALVTPGRNSLQPLPFDMVKGDDGVWSYTSSPQSPGYHNYWMLVDGAAVVDPATNAFIGYRHMCNGFEIPEPGVDFYDLKDIPNGNVVIKNYFSKTADSWRHIFVYTPPGYYANPKSRYPVLYLQHGGGEDRRVWIEMGRTNLILDNLLAAGKIKPFIVIMETSAVGAPTAGRGPGLGPGGGMGGPRADLMDN
jgi:enterochelin esterase family protein